MALTIRIGLNTDDVSAAIRRLEAYRDDLDRKGKEICRRLSDIGATVARPIFASAYYDGNNDVDVTPDETKNGYVVTASGKAVLFIEFGAGATYGYGHPEPMGYGPGTWPDPHYGRDSSGAVVPNWSNDRGWYTPKEAGGVHTYGNPPAMAMYLASQEVRNEVLRVAREVFQA